MSSPFLKKNLFSLNNFNSNNLIFNIQNSGSIENPSNPPVGGLNDVFGVEFYNAAVDGTGGRMDTSGTLGGLDQFTVSIRFNFDTWGGFAIGQWGDGGNAWIIAPSEFAVYGEDGIRSWWQNGGSVRFAQWTSGDLSTLDVHLVQVYRGFEALEEDRITLYAITSSSENTFVSRSIFYASAFGGDPVPPIVPTPFGTDGLIRIGGNTYGTAVDVDGIIADVAIWDIAMNEAQVQSLRGPNNQPENFLQHSLSGSLIHWWRMGDSDGGAGTTITDIGISGSDGILLHGGTGPTPAIVTI